MILFNLIPVVTVILAFLFLGQTLSSDELLGFIVVFLGATLVSLERANIFIQGLGMILIAIVIWSAITLFIDYGLTKMSFWDYFLLDTLGSALAGPTLFLIPSMRRQIISGLRTATVRKYIWFSGNNLLDFIGQTSLKKALALASSAGLVAVITQVQSFYAIVIGVLLTLLIPNVIREDVSARMLLKKFIGAAIMFCGVYILVT